MNCKGSSTISFVLILPWLIFGLLAVVTLFLWGMIGQTVHYAAYKGARAAQVYAFAGAKKEVLQIAPRSRMGLSDSKFFLVTRKPFQTSAPIFFTLEKETRDLSLQGKENRWGYPFMDNWAPFCGRNGDYGLCVH